MTNPGDIVRVRARRGGRASVYEANAWCQAFTQGVLEGEAIVPNTVPDLNVLVGGTPTNPNVLIATNPVGYKIALSLVGQQAVTLTAPANNSRISAIVAYTDDLALSTTENDVTGSPASCGLIVVNGAAGANPVAPTDAEIRTAITADGAAGSQASYAIVGLVTVSATTTLVTESLITVLQAGVKSQNIDFETMFPIGYLYFSSDSTNPSKYFPGTTWEAFAQGKTLVGVNPDDGDFNVAGKTGGEKTHLLTEKELPPDTWVSSPNQAGGNDAYSINGALNSGSFWGAHTLLKNQQPVNNLPPYVTVHIWRRVA